MNEYYVYVYCNPKFLFKCKNSVGLRYLPIYVGKGKGDRYKAHTRKANNIPLRKYIEKMKSEGISPKIIKVKENLSEVDAYKIEGQLIKELGVIYELEGPLFNKVVGNLIYETTIKGYVSTLIENYEDVIKSDKTNISINSHLSVTKKELYQTDIKKQSDVQEKPKESAIVVNKRYNYKTDKLNHCLPKEIIQRLKHYIKIGFTTKECMAIFGITYKHIFYNIDQKFIDMWTV